MPSERSLPGPQTMFGSLQETWFGFLTGSSSSQDNAEMAPEAHERTALNRDVTRRAEKSIIALNPNLKKAAEAVEVFNADRTFKGWCKFYWKRFRRGPASWRLLRKVFLTLEDPDEVIVPERYLEAAGEMFVLTAIIGWILTAIWAPETIKRNMLKDMIGYNNVCVGLDMPPARFVIIPFFSVTVYCGIRYVVLDSVRANLQIMSQAIPKIYARFTKFCNFLYACVLLIWPGLLVVTPANGKADTMWHTFIFFFLIIVQYLITLANFLEAEEVYLSSKVWFGMFTTFSILMPTFGIIDFRAYDYELCFCHALNCTVPTMPEQVEIILDDANTPYCQQEPAIPWLLLYICDYGWFVLLSVTTMFLPDAEPLYADYELVTLPKIEDGEVIHELEMHGTHATWHGEFVVATCNTADMPGSLRMSTRSSASGSGRAMPPAMPSVEESASGSLRT